MSNIVRCWETPTNEGTHARWVGKKVGLHTAIENGGVKELYEWEVGRIDGFMTWCRNDIATGEIKAVESSRIEIFDTDGILRVSLPASACAVEFDGTA